MSFDSLHISALRAQSLAFRIEEFVRSEIVTIANKTLVKTITDEAKQKDLPERYVNNIKSDFDGQYLWIWVDFKGKNNEPLDEYFEEGTRRHFISPRGGTSSRNPNLTNVLSWVKNGFRFFSKGHYVSGIKARHVFEDGFAKGYPEFKTELKNEIENYLTETSMFGR